METILCTGTELRALISEEVTRTLHDVLPEAVRRATAKPYLTKSELMELTGWSSRQVEYKKSQRAIPFIRRGRLVLFPTQEIFAFLEEGRVPVRGESDARRAR